MRLDIITCLPQLLEGHFSASIIKRALDKGKAGIFIHNLRDYAQGKYRKVDESMYGGGAGMVLMIEPIVRCIEHLQAQRTYDEIIYMAPDGELLTQPLANALSLHTNVIILCGHYKGVDERVRAHFITREISIGNYVISGGELAAAVLTDALIRLLPGVLSDETSALTDSFQDALVAPPAYTRPACFRGLCVPEVLRSGHEERVRAWRTEEALRRTVQRRPDTQD